MARVPTSLQVSAMARDLLNSQSVCIPLFSCQHCLAALTRQTVHSRCNSSLHLLQNCFLLECESTNHTLCSGESTTESFVHLHYCFPASTREILSKACSPFLWVLEDLFLVYFNHLLHVPAHSTFDKTGLNPMHLYPTAIFVDQDCLLFLTPKNLSEVFLGFFPIYSGLKCSQ